MSKIRCLIIVCICDIKTPIEGGNNKSIVNKRRVQGDAPDDDHLIEGQPLFLAREPVVQHGEWEHKGCATQHCQQQQHAEQPHRLPKVGVLQTPKQTFSQLSGFYLQTATLRISRALAVLGKLPQIGVQKKIDP